MAKLAPRGHLPGRRVDLLRIQREGSHRVIGDGIAEVPLPQRQPVVGDSGPAGTTMGTSEYHRGSQRSRLTTTTGTGLANSSLATDSA